MHRNLETVLTRCPRIAELAKQSPQMGSKRGRESFLKRTMRWCACGVGSPASRKAHGARKKTPDPFPSLSRKGNWVVKRKTAKSRLTRALRMVAQWCRVHRHQPIAEQHRMLSRKLKGHFAYYGITGNGSALAMFHREVTRTWRKWLSRRHRRGGYPWPQFTRLLERYPLPRPVVVHSVYRRAAK